MGDRERLADLLVSDFVPREADVRPALRRKPYLPKGSVIQCEQGHFIGVLQVDLPRPGDEEIVPSHLWEVADVPPEQAIDFIGGGSRKGEPLPSFVLEWIGTKEEVRRGSALSDGTCRICGKPWFKFTRRRSTGEVTGCRLRTREGWDGRPPRRRR